MDNEIKDNVDKTLDEIKELEPLIKESLIIINKAKEKTLEKKSN